MNNEIIDNVLANGIYDTARYRYKLDTITLQDDRQVQVIKRIRLEKLNTPAGQSDKSNTNLHGWETVFVHNV